MARPAPANRRWPSASSAAAGHLLLLRLRQLADEGYRLLDTDARWSGQPAFFDGFHRSIAAFASASLDLLVEHIVEQPSWAVDLDKLLRSFDPFNVAIRAPLDILKQRERSRGDRTLGEAEEYLLTYNYWTYNLEVKLLDQLRSLPSRWPMLGTAAIGGRPASA